MSDDIVIDSDDDIIIVDDDVPAPPKQSAPLCAESTSAHSSAEPHSSAELSSMPAAGYRKGAPCDAKLRKLLGV